MSTTAEKVTKQASKQWYVTTGSAPLPSLSYLRELFSYLATLAADRGHSRWRLPNTALTRMANVMNLSFTDGKQLKITSKVKLT